MISVSIDKRAEIDEAQKRLESLLGKGQEKNLNEITRCFHDILFSDSVTNEDAKRAASQFSKVTPKVISDVFRTCWRTSSANRKELALGELLKLKGTKGAEKQAAVAETLVSDYPEESARIVFHVLAGGKSKPSEISKGTEEVLRSKFLSPKSNKWIDLKSDDEEILRTLMSTFVQWAEDTKFESLGFLHNFLRWAITNFQNAHFDDIGAKDIGEKLDNLMVRLPETSQKELCELKQKQSSESDSSFQQSTDNLEKGNHEPSHGKSYSTTVSTSRPVEESDQSVGMADVPTAPSLTTKDTLLPSLIHQAEELLKQKKLEVAIYERLLEENKDLHEQLSATKTEAEKELIHAGRLSSKLETLENENKLLKTEKGKLIASEKTLRSDLADARRTLEAGTRELESSQSEYGAKIERKLQLEIESFKGKLKQNLAPLFKDKKGSDNDPLTEKLADYLRTWSAKLERALRDLGVDI